VAVYKEKIEVYGREGCPGSHSVRLVLQEKNIEHTFTTILPTAKPEWINEVSPPGKLPIVRHGAICIHTDKIINEYFDSLFPLPRLVPADPERRAQMHLWLDYCETKLLPKAVPLFFPDNRGKHEKALADLEKLFIFLEKESLGRLSGEGPYWLGAEMSLVDIGFFTVVGRVKPLEAQYGRIVPESCTRLENWYQVMAQRKSVQSLASAYT